MPGGRTNRIRPDIFPSALSALTWPRTRLRARIVSPTRSRIAGEVTAHLTVDLDRGDDPLEVLAAHPFREVSER